MKLTLKLLVLVATLIVSGVSASAQTIELEFAGWPSAGLIQPIIDQFEQENPDVKINVSLDTSEQILVRSAAGLPPDIYRVSWAEFREFALRGLALDLSRLLERDAQEINLDDYFAETLAPGQFNGKQFAMPQWVGGNLLWINKNLFDSSGIPVPEPGWTYDDFKEYSRRLSADTNGDGDVDRWGFSSVTHWAFWSGHVFSHGGSFFNEDRTEFTLDTPEMRNALSFADELVNVLDAAVPPGIGAGFGAGEVAMNLTSTGIMQNPPEFDYTVVANPSGSHGRRMMGGVQPLIIHPQTENAEAAWRFLKFVSRPDVQVWISENVLPVPPVRKSAIPMISNPLIATFAAENAYLEQHTDIIHGDIVGVVNEHLGNVLRGEESVQQASEEINRRLNVRLAEVLEHSVQ